MTDIRIVPLVKGDGVGPEVTGAMVEILDAAVSKAYGEDRRIEWQEVLAGGKAFEQCGTYLPDETLEAFKKYHIGIKGPLMTPVGGGIRSLNVALRQELDLFVCQRPVRWFKGVASPVRHPENVDMVIFRENTEDIYAGIEWAAGTPQARKFYDFIHNEMGVNKVRFPRHPRSESNRCPRKDPRGLSARPAAMLSGTDCLQSPWSTRAIS